MASGAPRAGQILSDLVNRLEFRERLRDHAVWNVWAEVVGPTIAGKTALLRIEDGKLFLEVSSSTWMQELTFLKDEIRRKLNARLERPVVRDLYFVLGRSRRRRKPPPDEVPVHAVDEAKIAALVPDLGRPEIEALLRRVARARARRLGPGA